MRSPVLLLLLAAIAFAGSLVQIGGLKFYEASSLQDLSSYLASHQGPTFVFVDEEGCPACEYMKTQVFTNSTVASALSGFNLVAIDITYVPVSSIPVYINGSVFVVENGQAGYTKPYYGPYQVPILGTPTMLVGYDIGGKLYLKGLLLGGLPPQGFLEFLILSGFAVPTETVGVRPPVATTAQSGVQPLLALPVAFAVGAASVFSPCVLPVLTVGAVAVAARRSLWKVLAGMVLSFSAFGVLVSALGQAASGFRVALEGAGGAVLLMLGLLLVVPPLERRFVVAMSGLQTKASKAARGAGDFALGLSLGAVWTPCIAPFMGLAAVSALVSGNFLDGFAIMLAYALGLAAALYAILKAISRWGKKAAVRSMGLSKWGRRLELVVGIASIALGILLLGEAAGLGLWSVVFGKLQSFI
ncbi:cytochrome c biogenesis protein, transmembrane region [Thermoproteus uzoniensis 768-20]|uniref:Cytochrome c biogenesis protein, transmembrane region n=1 Tax=Thermoproteus uzoniensis (strain 768-20) TaxID=999630 RepID=F2L5P4_THEU7|nr:cytochrome c biogenesis protein CcdA [Thermoproteus uzoniensis]AEA13590.1 cytochrome c biogenesis protein, transmembrane region [Thermoproteus uzoniensis 768-20]